jgi:hypothetical protein
VFQYMNHAEVKTRMQRIIKDVETELKNVEELTKEKVDLAPLWRAWIDQYLLDITKKSKEFLKAHVTTTEPLVKAGITKYDKLQKDLKTKEGPKSQDGTVSKAPAHQKHWDIQNKEAKRLDTQIANNKKKETKLQNDIKDTALKLKNIRLKYSKAKADEKKGAKNTSDALKKDKLKLEDQEVAEKLELDGVRQKMASDLRDKQELYADSVGQIIDGLKKDQDVLKKFSTAITKLEMPKAA